MKRNNFCVETIALVFVSAFICAHADVANGVGTPTQNNGCLEFGLGSGVYEFTVE